MLQLQTITPDTLELLKEIASRPEMQGLRLVGGTALALQYGHRQSVDLDFFGTPSAPQDEIVDTLSTLGPIVVHNRTDKILQFVLRGIKVDVIDYSRYAWIDDPVVESGITLSSPRDIAAMKINAVEGRGSRKDFVDIYMLLQHYSLGDLLDFYTQKYPNYSVFRALLNLTYFDDAETQAMPRMFIPTTWEEMKAFISDKVKRYGR
ncbi:MAG: nucleotidyl transferase AbiEii/AbiGii toxin family protein [Bacteroidales bacterium]|nr:nucleotidyl transferase AbiEii/AbiGii toxin family protein [Bacteroidales bacterium]